MENPWLLLVVVSAGEAHIEMQVDVNTGEKV